jgi:hypothetical protein
MSAATMQSTPAIPPRPSRSQDKDKGQAPSPPLVPPRPTNRKLNRSVSPNPDRFAPSPLNEGLISPRSPNDARRGSMLGASQLGHELERSTSVDLPGPGEEGVEYAAALEDIESSPERSRRSSAAPEQTRTVGEDIKLHAPKPTMPSQSAKQRVQAVTRTDSDRAAAFGIGRPSSADQGTPSRSLKKKPSTASQLSQAESQAEDEQGIPEIGQQVPMYPNAGDVQAPSPGPPSWSAPDAGKAPASRHVRKRSSRGFNDLPPGSYGLHGHGVATSDKLEKAYYEKHPELLQKEVYKYSHDRPNDFSMSSEDLNKIVRDTASRGAGLGTSDGFTGTPSEQVGFEASEAYASKASSPRPSASAPRDAYVTSPLKSSFSGPEVAIDDSAADDGEGAIIHVDEPEHRRGFAKYGDAPSVVTEGGSDTYVAPILAPDEVAKGPSPYELHPAVEPPPERSGSAFEMDEPKSRPSSRPASVYSPVPPELHSTPLEDVKEYDPLFPEDQKNGAQPSSPERRRENAHRYPSRDIWEDAPNSVYMTAVVSTPDLPEHHSKPQASVVDVPPREGETPAQAFARRQEELAEKEAQNTDSFLYRNQKPPSYVDHQSHISKETQGRPSASPRFPSRDVWEDTPDSLQYTTTVSSAQTDRESPPTEPDRNATEKPSIPSRPKKQNSGDESTSKPVVPGRPKPQIPSRPSKPSSDSKGTDQAQKPKPAVPTRPAGGKIAALQAGFMTDLNKRLQLGPQAPKVEEASAAPDLTEEKEKAPLADARKGRARGPQRRAPTKSSSPSSGGRSAPPPASNGKPVLSFSMTCTLWSIDEEGTMTVESGELKDAGDAEPKAATVNIQEIEPKAAKVEVPETTIAPEAQREESQSEDVESEQAPNQAEAADTEGGKPSDKGEAPKSEAPPPSEETKTLVTNTAGESILEEIIQKEAGSDKVKKVEDAKDDVINQ